MKRETTISWKRIESRFENFIGSKISFPGEEINRRNSERGVVKVGAKIEGHGSRSGEHYETRRRRKAKFVPAPTSLSTRAHIHVPHRRTDAKLKRQVELADG